MANNFSLNRNVTTAWAAQIKAQKGVMLEPQVRKSGTGFKVVHRMPFASLLHGLLWKISKGYRNNRIEERHAFLNVLEDQVRGSYGLENKYSSNGHRLANPEEGKPILGTLQSALAPAGNPGGSPALPSKCYEKLKNDTEPSALLFNRINAARENASVNRKAYMTSLHEVFLGIATEDPYSEADDVASFKQEWRKPKDATSDNKLAEACRRETVAYEAKRQKATGGSYISEAMEILPPVAQTPRPPAQRRQAPPPPRDSLTQRQDPDYEEIPVTRRDPVGIYSTLETTEEQPPDAPEPYDGPAPRNRHLTSSLGSTRRPVPPLPHTDEDAISVTDQAQAGLYEEIPAHDPQPSAPQAEPEPKPEVAAAAPEQLEQARADVEPPPPPADDVADPEQQPEVAAADPEQEETLTDQDPKPKPEVKIDDKSINNPNATSL